MHLVSVFFGLGASSTTQNSPTRFFRAYPLHCLEPFVLRQLVAAVIIQLLPGELQFFAKGVDQELHEFLAPKAGNKSEMNEDEYGWWMEMIPNLLQHL